MINGSWIHFDPLLAPEKRFNDTGFYERSKDEGGWGKQISYVIFIDLDGRQHNITHRYTDTGKLIVRVEKDKRPVENTKVIIKSRFLMETNPKYNNPLFCFDKYTNESGLYTFDLGGNNYTVVAELGKVIGYRDEVNVTLKENDDASVTLYLTELSLLLSGEEILTILLIFLVSILLILEFIIIYRKFARDNRFNRTPFCPLPIIFLHFIILNWWKVPYRTLCASVQRLF